MPHNDYSLSNSQPRLVIPVGELVDAPVGSQSVTLLQRDSSELPVVIDRPADDDLAVTSGIRHGMISQKGICLTEDGGDVTGDPHAIEVAFNSTVAGTAYLSIHAAVPYSSPFWVYGNFDSTPSGNTTQRRSIQVSLNGTTRSGVNIVGAQHGQSTDRPFQWLAANSATASSAFAFTVNSGSNTILISADNGNNHGAGVVIDGVSVDLVRTGVPVPPDQQGPQTCRDVAPYGFDRFNMDAAVKLLRKAKAERVGIMVEGSSLTARGGNWAVTFRDLLEAEFGKAGLIQRAGTGGSADRGVDLPTASETSWLTATDKGMLRTGASGGSDYNGLAQGDRGYQWASGQTGTLSMAVPAGCTSCRVVYRTYASGSTLAINDGATLRATPDTTGTDNRFSHVEVDCTAGNTLSISKSTSAGSAGVAAVIPFFASTGVYVGRLCQAGQSIAENYANTKEELKSYLAACGIQVSFCERANEGVTDAGSTSEMEAYLPDYGDMIEALTPAGGALVLADLYGYNTSGFDATGGWDTLAPTNMPDWMHTVLALIDTDYWPTRPGWLSGYHRIGEDETVGNSSAYKYLLDNDGYSGQSGSVVTDMHTSDAGGVIVGTAIFDIVKEATGEGYDGAIFNAIGYWPMQETSSSTLEDQSGSSDLTLSSVTLPSDNVAGPGFGYDSAINFAGAGEASFANALVPATDDFTLSLWVNPNTLDGGVNLRLIVQSSGGEGRLLISAKIQFNTGLRFFIGDSGGNVSIDSPSNLPIGSWTHLAFERVGDVFNLYVDGALAGTYTQTGISIEQGTPFSVCDNLSGSRFDGALAGLVLTRSTGVAAALYAGPPATAGRLRRATRRPVQRRLQRAL